MALPLDNCSTTTLYLIDKSGYHFVYKWGLGDRIKNFLGDFCMLVGYRDPNYFQAQVDKSTLL